MIDLDNLVFISQHDPISVLIAGGHTLELQKSFPRNFLPSRMSEENRIMFQQ
jgi:hypothetical protein